MRPLRQQKKHRSIKVRLGDKTENLIRQQPRSVISHWRRNPRLVRSHHSFRGKCYTTLQQAEQKSVAVLDKRISEALSYADEVVDVKKDEAIEGVVSAKKAINTLGPVQTVVVSRVGSRMKRILKKAAAHALVALEALLAGLVSARMLRSVSQRVIFCIDFCLSCGSSVRYYLPHADKCFDFCMSLIDPQTLTTMPLLSVPLLV